MALFAPVSLAISFNPQTDLTTPTAFLIYGLAGFVVVLWIFGILLARGGSRKAAGQWGAYLQDQIKEIKDLLDGFHENFNRLADGMELHRDKMDNRLGAMSRNLESLPRVNENVAKLRESLPQMEQSVAAAVEAAAQTLPASSGDDAELRAQLERARAELTQKEDEMERLRSDLEGFHEAMEAQALNEDTGNESALREKYAALEEEKKALTEQVEKFEKHQTTIKTQIKEAGEKLKKMQEEVRREKEEVLRLKSGDQTADSALAEERRKIEREWEMVEQQQSMLRGEREWIEAEKAALEEHRKALQGGVDGAPPAPPAPPEPAAPAEPQEENMAALGYSSLEKKAPARDLPDAPEEDIPMAEEEDIVPNAPAPANSGGWEDLLAGQNGGPPTDPAAETVTDPEPGPHRDMNDLLPGADPAPVPPTSPGEVEPAPMSPEEASALFSQDLGLKGASTPTDDIAPHPDEAAPMPEPEPPSQPEPQPDSTLEPAAVPAQAGPPVGDVSLEQRTDDWKVGFYEDVMIVRLTSEEVKNPEAHALDDIIFGETDDKDDRILLDLTAAKYINSRGLSSLTKVAVQRTCHIVLDNESVVKVMDMMGFLPLFTLFEEYEKGMQAFAEVE